MKIEEFIKHLESRGYKLNDKCDYFTTFHKKISKTILRSVVYFWDGLHSNKIQINSNTNKTVYFGFIESLEQFDLIDRLTS